MLRLSSAASGEDIASFEEVDEVELGSTIGSLKRHLANKHFEDRFSRFQLRLFRAGDASELSDDEVVRRVFITVHYFQNEGFFLITRVLSTTTGPIKWFLRKRRMAEARDINSIHSNCNAWMWRTSVLSTGQVSIDSSRDEEVQRIPENELRH